MVSSKCVHSCNCGQLSLLQLGSQNGTRIEENLIVNSSARDNPQGQGAIHHDEGTFPRISLLISPVTLQSFDKGSCSTAQVARG